LNFNWGSYYNSNPYRAFFRLLSHKDKLKVRIMNGILDSIYSTYCVLGIGKQL